MLKIIAGNMIARLHVTKQRGQVALFYALIVPVMIFCVGVALDLGWYYLNVSRLQNAADSAVLAGASKLIESNAEVFDGYTIKLVYEYPADKPYKDPTTSTTKSALKSTAKSTATIDTTESDQEAATYTLKNLSSDDNWAKALVPAKKSRAPEFFFSVAEAEDDEGYTKKTLYTMNDNWSHGGNPRIMMTPSLYQDEEDYYYVVQIQEDIRHFFIGFLGDMNAPVVSVALLTKATTDPPPPPPPAKPVKITFDANGGTLDDNTTKNTKEFTAPSEMEDDATSDPLTSGKGTPTYSNNQKEFKGWSTTKDPKEGQIIKIYHDGEQLTKNEIAALFGDETEITLYAVWEDVLPTNNKTLWEQMQYIVAKDVYDGFWKYATRNWTQSPYNLGFAKYQLSVKTAKSGYTYYEDSVTLASNTSNNGKTIGQMDKLYLDYQHDGFTRLSDSSSVAHSHINVNAAYSIRSSSNDDPLYIRIENEPVRNGTTTAVRQVVININADNSADNKRPLFFFYDKPENNRDPKPVILNLNKNFKGVLFMPEAPVVINGNGHKFEGFIVAKEYHYLSTSGANISGTKYYIDTKGNIQTIKATGNNAKEMFDYNGTNRDRFYLSDDSKFKMFNMEHQVNYAYVWYDMDGNIIEEPFHERYTLTNDLIPIYGNSGRITKWENVTLFKDPMTDSNGNKVINRRKVDNPTTEISDKDPGLLKYGAITLLDDDGYPIPIYDEAGNPIYFVNDYGRLGKDYTVLTLDKVTNKIRTPHEFLIETKESNTDDWI